MANTQTFSNAATATITTDETASAKLEANESPLAPGIGELIVKVDGVKELLAALSVKLTELYQDFEKTAPPLMVMHDRFGGRNYPDDAILARLENFVAFINDRDREISIDTEFWLMAYNLKIALAKLHTAMESPPAGFNKVAATLWEAARIAHAIDCKDETVKNAVIVMHAIDRAHTDLHFAIIELWGVLFSKALTPPPVNCFALGMAFYSASETQVFEDPNKAQERERNQRLAEMIAKMQPLQPQAESDTIEKLRAITFADDYESLKKAAMFAHMKMKAHDKLREIDRLIRFRNEATAKQLGAALMPPRSRQDVIATEFWKEELMPRRKRDKKETNHGKRAVNETRSSLKRDRKKS